MSKWGYQGVPNVGINKEYFKQSQGDLIGHALLSRTTGMMKAKRQSVIAEG